MWFDFNLELLRFAGRVTAYSALLTDVYPSTDEEQAIHIQLPEPDPARLNRWLPLVKWLLAIPHLVALVFLSRGAVVAVGVGRWSLRVIACAFALVADEYPPFLLGA